MSQDPGDALQEIERTLKMMETWILAVFIRLKQYDHLGEAEAHPEGSAERRLAQFRDSVEVLLSRKLPLFSSCLRERARESRSEDVLVGAALAVHGDGHVALELMERWYELHGDEAEGETDIPPGTFPDSFAWETYQRVIALNELVLKYPRHMQSSARQMHGWPMIVSHHIDGTGEFNRIAELLQVGASHPLNTGPRPKRGTETPFLRYLEQRLWRVDALRTIYHETDRFWKTGTRVERVRQFWRQDHHDPEPDEELVNILVLVPDLPVLTHASAPQWAREVLVPLIMHQDAADPETCQIPVLQEIWRHRSVKSRATFESRLYSRVLDTLRRYARDEPKA